MKVNHVLFIFCNVTRIGLRKPPSYSAAAVIYRISLLCRSCNYTFRLFINYRQGRLTPHPQWQWENSPVWLPYAYQCPFSITIFQPPTPNLFVGETSPKALWRRRRRPWLWCMIISFLFHNKQIGYDSLSPFYMFRTAENTSGLCGGIAHGSTFSFKGPHWRVCIRYTVLTAKITLSLSTHSIKTCTQMLPYYRPINFLWTTELQSNWQLNCHNITTWTINILLAVSHCVAASHQAVWYRR